MELIFFYEESRRQWVKRGYANNIWLRVNFGAKTYKLTTTYNIPPRDVPSVVTVTTKSDILDLAKELEKQGFITLGEKEERYMAVFGPNSKQFWIYDGVNDTYIDPPLEILEEIDKIRWKDGDETADSIGAAEDRLEEIANSNPDWLHDGNEYSGSLEI